MGRYISGDIEAKCWFGVQDSNFADRFGVKGEPPPELEYYFEDTDLPKVEKELKKIRQHLKGKLSLLNKFFDKHNAYTMDELYRYLKVDKETGYYLLQEYADYCRGVDIKDCIKEKGYCSFSVEL